MALVPYRAFVDLHVPAVSRSLCYSFLSHHSTTMVTLAFVASLALFTAPGLAGPMGESLNIRHLASNSIICQIPILKTYICSPSTQIDIVRMTPQGQAKGTVDPGGAYRFVVKYANSERWKHSSTVSTWGLPCVFSI